MDFKVTSEDVIQKYKEDEQIMIRLFIQWCKNNELDPHQLYRLAYPEQPENEAMKKMLLDPDEDQQMDIDNETMIDVLQLFGNDDLAYIIAEVISRLPPK